jgi:hypothetical protein
MLSRHFGTKPRIKIMTFFNGDIFRKLKFLLVSLLLQFYEEEFLRLL